MRYLRRTKKRVVGVLLSVALVLSSITPSVRAAGVTEVAEEPIVLQTSAGNIINNPTFSNGMDGWKLLTDQGGAATTSNSNGGLAVNITNAGPVEWGVQLCQENMSLAFGMKYTVSVDIMSTATKSVVVSLQDYDSTTYTASNFGTKTVELQANTRTTINFETTTLTSNISTGKLYIGMGTVNGSAVASTVTVYSVSAVPSEGATYNKLVWSDEFDGNSLNTGNWTCEIGNGANGWGNAELQYYTDRAENVSVADGMLKITAKREDYNGYQYTSARLKTQGKRSFKYGKLEARLRIEKGQGNWPAFWMLGESISSVGWPKCGEIDIMEWANGWQHTLGTLHWANGGEAHAYNTGYTTNSSLGSLDVSQWHTYSVIWDEYAMHFLCDDVEYHTIDITSPEYSEFHENQFFLLNVAVGGSFVTGGVVESDLINGKSMYVDYVRVYELGEAGSNNNNQGTTEETPGGSGENLPVTPGTSLPGNIITNPLFENGTTNWNPYVHNGAGNATYNKNASAGLDVDITSVGSEGWHVQLSQENLNLSAGKKYEVTVDLASTAARSVITALENYNASTQSSDTYGTKTTALKANERTTIKFTTNVVSADTSTGKMYIGLGNVSGNDAGSKVRIYSVNVVPVDAVNSNIQGKIMFFLGSSVTYGYASNGVSFADYIASRNNSTSVKEAVSGTTLVDNGSSSYVQRMVNNLDTNAHCDHFICQLSTNDASQNKPLGSVSNSYDLKDFDTSTIIGAMEYIIAYAKSNWNCPVSFYTGTYYNSANYQAMVNALFELQKKWDVGIIDLWNNASMRAVSDADRARYMADDIHPTAAGYEEWWTPVFEEYLQNYDYSGYTSQNNRPAISGTGNVLYYNQFDNSKGLQYYSGQEASAPIYLGRTVSFTGGNSNKLVVADKEYTNFVVEADIKVNERDTYTNQGGIIFRAKNPYGEVADGYDGYYFGIDAKNNQVILGKVHGNVWTEIATANVTLDHNKYYHLSVAVNGNKIACYVDYDGSKAPVLTVEDGDFASGTVGFRHWMASATYKNLKVSEYNTAEEPKTEAPTTEEPKTEAPTTEEPKTEAPTTEEPKTEAPTTEEPKTETPTTEEPKTEAPTTEEPKTEAPTTEEPKTETPTTEEPKTEAPTTEEPKTEAPTTEEPKTEAPTTEEPKTEAPTTEEPKTEAPTTEEPKTEAPTTEEPKTEIPTTEEPKTEVPTTEEPKTEVPTTETNQNNTGATTESGTNAGSSNNAGNNGTTESTGNTGNTGGMESGNANVGGTVEEILGSLTSNLTEKDAEDSNYAQLSLRVSNSTGTLNKLKWNKVQDADGYIILSNRCGKKLEVIKTIENGKTTKFTHKKLKKATYYKYVVLAYKMVDGKQVILTTSKTIHVPTTGGKYTDIKSIKVNKTKVSLKVGKTFTIKAKEVKKVNSKKIKRHRKISYETSDAAIATVSSKGKITAKAKGECYIYIYAQNGVSKKIKVTVK